MGQVIIRNLDDKVIRRLRDRAKARNVSLEQELRDVLTQSVTVNLRNRVAQIDEALMLTPALSDETRRIEGWELIREDRDGR